MLGILKGFHPMTVADTDLLMCLLNHWWENIGHNMRGA